MASLLQDVPHSCHGHQGPLPPVSSSMHGTDVLNLPPSACVGICMTFLWCSAHPKHVWGVLHAGRTERRKAPASLTSPTRAASLSWSTRPSATARSGGSCATPATSRRRRACTPACIFRSPALCILQRQTSAFMQCLAEVSRCHVQRCCDSRTGLPGMRR